MKMPDWSQDIFNILSYIAGMYLKKKLKCRAEMILM